MKARGAPFLLFFYNKKGAPLAGRAMENWGAGAWQLLAGMGVWSGVLY